MSADTAASEHRFTNRLAREKSPYLLQHAHNPVDWYPWGEEAFQAAREQNKPIFLSVGYSACHWCHVMERESFENESIGQLLNAHFIPVKVDREERPDVDEIYMTAVQMMTRHGGWPMSMFLTPDGRPFYGGTYFPPDDRHGRPGFPTLLHSLADAWVTRRDEVERIAEQMAEDLQEATRQRRIPAPEGALDADALLRRGVAELAARFDEDEGGFGPAPKFPPHHSLALLLEAVRREGEHGGNTEAQRMLAFTLDKMALGGVYDHVGGGFHRYSTDAHWLLPHFEKMLYDNALLARVYADAFATTGRAAYARIARETCDWVLRDMTGAEGGFHAALDADSEGEEGKYYVWSRDEILQLLGPTAGPAFAARYNIRPEGNFHDESTGRATGLNIPHLSGPELPDALDPALAEARSALLQARSQRVPPGKDDKVITSWNGLMIGGLAHAGKVLGEPRYVEAARRAAEFCLTTLRPDGTHLLRRFRDGEAAFDAYLEDYAFLADGLLDLHAATGEERWAAEARSLADTLLADFWDDEDGGFFFTGAHHEALIARSKELFDGATPSPNGVAARVLARLSRLPGGEAYGVRARAMLEAFHGYLDRVPHGTQTLVLAALIAFAPSESEATSAAAADPITLAVEGTSPLRVAPGGTATASFLLTVAPGWHVNAHRVPDANLIPTAAVLASDLPAALGPVRYPAPTPWQTPGTSEDPLPTYQGAARFEVPLVLAADALPGRYTVALTVRFQPCSETECLPPAERSVAVRVEVTDPALPSG